MTTTQKSFKEQIIHALDVRARFEKRADVENSNIQKTLASIKSDVNHDSIAQIMFAANVSLDVFNASQRADERCNVYTLEKIANIARNLASVTALNHYTRAILLTASKIEASASVMTRDDAKNACSLQKQVKNDKERDALIVRYSKNVASSTVKSQHSSSLDALVKFNVLTRSQNAAAQDCFKLVDSDTTRDLIERAKQ